MTKTALSSEALATLQVLHEQMQELHNLNHNTCHAPSLELERMNEALSTELQDLAAKHGQVRAALVAKHKQVLAELEEQQNLEMEVVHNKDKARRQELRETILASNDHFNKESSRLIKEAGPILERLTLTDTIALIPEDARPTLIETASKEMFILQHKLNPECGFLIWAEGGHDTKWSVHVRNLLSGVRRHLVCFCGNGCMDNETHTWLVDSLTNTCVKHGIKTLLGRRVGEDKNGIQFRDGSYYNIIAAKFPTGHQTRRANYFVRFNG